MSRVCLITLVPQFLPTTHTHTPEQAQRCCCSVGSERQTHYCLWEIGCKDELSEEMGPLSHAGCCNGQETHSLFPSGVYIMLYEKPKPDQEDFLNAMYCDDNLA